MAAGGAADCVAQQKALAGPEQGSRCRVQGRAQGPGGMALPTQVGSQQQALLACAAHHPASPVLRQVAQQIRSAQQKAALAGQAPPAWAIGAKCQAVYSLDGEWYAASVVGVTTAGDFVVNFAAYGNTEQARPGRPAPLHAPRAAALLSTLPRTATPSRRAPGTRRPPKPHELQLCRQLRRVRHHQAGAPCAPSAPSRPTGCGAGSADRQWVGCVA